MKISIVKVKNLKSFPKDGKLKFYLPGYKHKSNAEVDFVELIDEENYEWCGILHTKQQDNAGTMTIIKDNEKTYGKIIIEGRRFTLEDIGNSKDKKGPTTLLIEKDPLELTENE